MPWQPLCPARAGAERVPVVAPSARTALKWLCSSCGGMLLLGGKSAPAAAFWVAELQAWWHFAGSVCAGCSCIPTFNPREARGLGSSLRFLQLGFPPRHSLACVCCQFCLDSTDQALPPSCATLLATLGVPSPGKEGAVQE